MNRRHKKIDHCNPNWRNYDISVIEEKIRKSDNQKNRPIDNQNVHKLTIKQHKHEDGKTEK